MNRAKVAAAVARRQRARRRDGLETIPGVGPSIAADLRELGATCVGDLAGRDPEALYRRLIRLRGVHQDRCLLYVFRCAVYYATVERPAPGRLQWWRWSDRALAPRGSDRAPRPGARPR